MSKTQISNVKDPLQPQSLFKGDLSLVSLKATPLYKRRDLAGQKVLQGFWGKYSLKAMIAFNETLRYRRRKISDI